jgi:translation elongation factor EF-1beta
MSFSDHASLNAHLADKSYIEGWSFSQKDVEVFAAFSLPCPAAHPHAYRWYIHIAALSGIPSALKNTAPASGHSGAAAAPAAKKEAAKKAPAKAADDEEDDEMDLGFDDEEEEEEEKPAGKSRAEIAKELKAQRDKEAEEKKAAALARLAKKEANQRSLCNLEIKPWESDQDLMELFAKIKRTVVMDGLKWSENCALVDVAFGIKKLVLTAVISLNLSMDAIIEEMTEETFVDEIQSMQMTSMSLL